MLMLLDLFIHCACCCWVIVFPHVSEGRNLFFYFIFFGEKKNACKIYMKKLSNILQTKNTELWRGWNFMQEPRCGRLVNNFGLKSLCKFLFRILSLYNELGCHIGKKAVIYYPFLRISCSVAFSEGF